MARYVRQHLPSFIAVAVAIAAAIAGLLAVGSNAPPLQTVALDQIPGPSIPSQIAAAPVRARPAEPAYTFIWPASGAISQGMTAQHPRGLDIAAEPGDPVIAVRAGEVISAGGDPCCVYGLHVIVQHADGWSSLYAHLDSLSVEAGVRVEQGDILGIAGSTGKASGVHLHFELLSLGAPVNPLGQLQPTRSYTPVIEPLATPSILTEPRPTVEQSDLADAIYAARRWMAQQGETGYQIDNDTCFALAVGPNWSVSCAVTPWGCEGAMCRSFLEACVIGSLKLVEATCSGY